jgi:hypothetical protein
MTFLGSFLPPFLPMHTQATVAFLRQFMGHKKSDFDLLPIQDLCNEGRNTHVTRVKREVQGFGTCSV